MALLDEEVAVDQAAQIVRTGLAQPPWGGAHVAQHALDVVCPGFAVAQLAKGTLVGQRTIRYEVSIGRAEFRSWRGKSCRYGRV